MLAKRLQFTLQTCLFWNFLKDSDRQNKIIPAFFFLILVAFQARAQNSLTVSGTVTEADNGSVLPGVNVVVKGAPSVGTATDTDGKYSLTVSSANDTLIFSFIGFQTKEVAVNSRNTVDVTMASKAFEGSEVVVVGYGTQQRQDVNGSVSSVSSKDIKDLINTDVSSLLQGQAAGVTVTQNSGKPGGAASVRIRGITSITGNNEPLYVIDGVPVSGDATNSSTSGTSDISAYPGSEGSNTVSPLTGLNPEDIQSIDVLKDASATAIYGSRGANGVVIITTKSGSANESKISYNGSVGMQEPMKLLDMMDLPTYARLQNDLAKIYPGLTPRPEFARPSLLGEGTDWQDAVYRRSFMQNHQLSFSGGNDATQYYISGGYTDQEGIVLASNLNRYTLKANIDAQVTDFFRAGIKVNGSIADQDLPLSGSYNGAVAVALLQAPDLPIYNADGTFAGVSMQQDPATESRINPVARALSITNTLNRQKALGSLYGIVDISDNLSFKSSFGGNIRVTKNNRFIPTYDWGRFVNKQATLYNSRNNFGYYNWSNTLTYQNTFSEKHDLKLLLGQEIQKSTWEGINATGQGFVTNDIQTLNLAQPTGSNVGGFKGSYTQASFFSRLNYAYDKKYGLTATIRADGSSKFAEDNRWGYFPSVAASWKVYEEPFMEQANKYVDQITLKAGYGVTGNQDIGNYLYTSNLRAIATGLGTAFGVGNISNSNLKWEKSKQLNLGISFGLFNNQLYTSFEVYNKLSSRFLYQLPLPSYLTGGPGYQGGVSAPFVNLGEMSNKGFDLTFKYNTAAASDFNWSSKLTISSFKNNVKELYNKNFDIIQVLDTGYLRAPITRTVEGKPVGLFYGYKVKGTFNDEKTIRKQPKQFGQSFNPNSQDSLWLGDLQYVDVNKDGVVDEKDRTFIGNPHPDFTFGFNNRFNYKNISLSVFLQGSYGNDIYNYTRTQITGLNRLYNNQLQEAANYWRPDNRDTDIPRPRRGDGNNNTQVSDRYVEDGSYIRLKNMTLGYTLPLDISQRFEVNKFRIYVSATNLYTLTKYKGYDPDVGAFNQSALFRGIDNGRYQEARTFTLGLNIDF